MAQLALTPTRERSTCACCLWSAGLGALVWLVRLATVRPTPFQPEWAAALLLLGPLVLVPLGLRLTARPDAEAREMWLGRTAAILQFPAALALVAAFGQPPGLLAAALALPWLIVTGLIALYGVARWWGSRHAEGIAGGAISAGLVYIAVGGGWAVISRYGLRPLAFEPIIVLLTAIHFHYAGFVLPMVAGFAARALPGRLTRAAAVGVTVGTPLVAAGITATALKLPPAFESVVACLLAAAGLLVAWAHLRLAAQARGPVRTLFGLAGASLCFSMVLAALYGLRHFGVTPGLDIPWMRALHGTANAFGFALGTLVGWTLALGSRGDMGAE